MTKRILAYNSGTRIFTDTRFVVGKYQIIWIFVIKEKPQKEVMNKNSKKPNFWGLKSILLILGQLQSSFLRVFLTLGGFH